VREKKLNRRVDVVCLLCAFNDLSAYTRERERETGRTSETVLSLLSVFFVSSLNLLDAWRRNVVLYLALLFVE
jgi:hypothetical protein